MYTINRSILKLTNQYQLRMHIKIALVSYFETYRSNMLPPGIRPRTSPQERVPTSSSKSCWHTTEELWIIKHACIGYYRRNANTNIYGDASTWIQWYQRVHKLWEVWSESYLEQNGGYFPPPGVEPLLWKVGCQPADITVVAVLLKKLCYFFSMKETICCLTTCCIHLTLPRPHSSKSLNHLATREGDNILLQTTNWGLHLFILMQLRKVKTSIKNQDIRNLISLTPLIPCIYQVNHNRYSFPNR